MHKQQLTNAPIFETTMASQQAMVAIMQRCSTFISARQPTSKVSAFVSQIHPSSVPTASNPDPISSLSPVPACL